MSDKPAWLLLITGTVLIVLSLIALTYLLGV